MSKSDILPQFECQNRNLNVKIRYSAPVRMFKYDFECQNSINGPNSNGKTDFECQNSMIGPSLNVKIEF